MNFSLPVIDAHTEPLDPEFLNNCECGSCSQCGLCCIAYSIEVPGVRGDIDSEPYMKRRGEPCPQLIRDARGKYSCALHAEKMAGDPRLAVCKNWNGGTHRTMELSALTAEWAVQPPSLAAVEELRHMMQRGVHTLIDLECDETTVIDTVTHYICTLGICPVDIFRNLEIRSHIKTLYFNNVSLYLRLDRRLWETSEELYREFFDFIWGPEGIGRASSARLETP